MSFTKQQVQHIADLANIPLKDEEVEQLTKDFAETLEIIDNLNELDTKNVEPTHQVTGLANVTREDNINKDTMFTQEEALANAPKAYKGYFVVPRILDNDQ